MTDISDNLRKEQMKLKKTYYEWEEHFKLLTTNMPIDTQKKIKESTDFIKNQIELKSDWAIERTSKENIIRIRDRFKILYGVCNLFNNAASLVLIPDTNALIRSPDPNLYKELMGDTFVMILTPTVLS